MTQTDLFEADKATDKAIDAAGAFANPDWYRAAEYAVVQLVRRGADFTTDDVWEYMRDLDLKTPEPRALGSIIRQAAKGRDIVATGVYRKSMRPECHRRPLLVWRPVRYKAVTREAE